MKFRIFSKEVFAFIILLLAFLGIGFVNGTPFIFGDAFGYYHVAKTEVDSGVYPTNTVPEYFEYTGHAVINSEGKFITPYSVGQSILYFPFLWFSSAFDSGTPNDNYYKAFNGHSFADGIAILSAAALFAYLGIIFCYLFLKELGFSKKLSFLSTLSVYFSLYLLSYTFEQPGYSHVYEFFAYSAFLYLFTKFFFKRQTIYLYLAACFAGLLVLIRIVDVALILIPFLFVIYKIRRLKVILTTLLILGFWASLLLKYNFISYGDPFTLGYTSRGQSGFEFGLNIFNLLFSDTRGLYVWSPLVLLSTIGLVMYVIKSKSGRLFFGLSAILLIAIYNFWNNWWGGVSAGQRFFIVLAPLFALGLSYLYTQFKYRVIVKYLAFALVMFGILTSVLYRITPILQMNSTYRNDSQSVTPPENEDYRLTDLYKHHFQLFTQKTSLSSYFSNISSGLNGGRSLMLLQLGLTDPLVRVKEVSNLEYKFYFIPDNKNTNHSINLFVTFSYKDLSRSYLMSTVNFKNANSASVTCDSTLNCTSEDLDLLPALSDLSREKFARLSPNSKVSVYGENIRINYINLKIK